MPVLVVDVGGTSVKLAVAGTESRARFDSSSRLSPTELVQRVLRLTQTWRFDVVSMGYPGETGSEGPRCEPGNLGSGWVGFDFAQAFGRPVRLVNDAVLQAIGAYRDGRLLFVGLGTGIGSAVVSERVAVGLELGELPHSRGGTLMDHLGRAALERRGLTSWREDLLTTMPRLRRAFLADYMVLGGGHAEHLHELPEGILCGGNEDAIEGGRRLWEEATTSGADRPAPLWRVVG